MRKRTALILVAIISTVIAVSVIIGVSIHDQNFPYGEESYNGIAVYFKEDTPISEEVAILNQFDADIFDDELPHYYTLSFPEKPIQYVTEQLNVLSEMEQVDRADTIGVAKSMYDLHDYGENGKIRDDD